MFKPDDPLAPRQPHFSEGWHAQALALADTMVTSGRFSANEWASALGEALKQVEASGAPDTEETYYKAVISALETLTTSKTDIGQLDIDTRKSDWIKAYKTTLHGQPVKLK